MKAVLYSVVLFLGAMWLSVADDATSAPPIDPRQLTAVTFGSYSHWLQPWRAYLETVPASRFLDGIGIVLNSDPVVLPICAKYGIRQARIEIGWGSIDFADETRLDNAVNLSARLKACRDAGIRPLILLNGHHGVPCPMLSFERVVTAPALAGAREVTLDRTDDLVIGHSGISSREDYIAAEYLITKIEGHTVTLSQPLKAALGAGTKVLMATLKYAPFGDATTPEGQATLAGWKRYVSTVARFAANTLGTAGHADLGFDLEIWNEMSFGSNFIDQGQYYDPLPHPFNRGAVYLDVVRATAQAAEAEPALFAGVRLVDGFSNTLPWPASSELPARVTALSHHPYAGRKIFPKDESKGTPLNALGLPDKSGFIPSYEACFPEYYACALQTETIVRDMAPLATDIYQVGHGRFTRPGNPCWCWITEVNYDSVGDGITDPALALRVKAKAAARYYCFYLNKGVERLYLFGTGANDPKTGDLDLGVLKQACVDRLKAGGTVDDNDPALISPALLAIRHITDHMRSGLDPGEVQTRRLQLLRIADSHGAKQFEGDPAAPSEHPPLYDRDVLAVLPYQVNARKFVIAYYVMTRDVRRDLTPEKFAVTLKGINGAGAQIEAYDPILDRAVGVRAVSVQGDELELELTATDYPVLLEITEAASPSP